MGSPELYQRRKKEKLERQHPRPTFETNSLHSHERPHRTIPELVEHYPEPWIPPPPTPPDPCRYDQGNKYDSGLTYDNDECSQPTPTPEYMIWDTGIKWDSGWKWK